jgi:hypothetical protein
MNNLQTQPNMDQHDAEQYDDEQSHAPIAAPARRLSGAAAVCPLGGSDTPIVKFNRSCHGCDSNALDGA